MNKLIPRFSFLLFELLSFIAPASLHQSVTCWPKRHFADSATDDPNSRYPCGTCNKTSHNVAKPFKVILVVIGTQPTCRLIIAYVLLHDQVGEPLNVRLYWNHIRYSIKNIEYNEDLNLCICPPEGIRIE